MNPLEALRKTVAHLKSPKIAGLPTLTGGLVGYMGYDSVRRLEKLPILATKDIELPEIAFMLTSDLAVMDHSEGTITLIANVQMSVLMSPMQMQFRALIGCRQSC